VVAAAAHLLVCHVRRGLRYCVAVHRTNDPDFRYRPLTWGACRTNVRRHVAPGADLLFVAYDRDAAPDAKYQVTALFRVGALLHQEAAARRYAGRANVLLNVLPGTGDVSERLVAYIRDHRDELRWWAQDGRREGAAILAELDVGAELLRASAATHVLRGEDGLWYVHSYWDHHRDWRSRVAGPYVVADRAETIILPKPISYGSLARRFPSSLPSVGALRNDANRHPDRAIRDAAVLAYLRDHRGHSRRRNLARHASGPRRPERGIAPTPPGNRRQLSQSIPRR